MKEYADIYTKSLTEAADASEHMMWRKSFRENVHCAMAIERAISDNFDGYRLNDSCADRVVTEYGLDRVKWVLAATIQEAEHDGRFSRENKAWASELPVPKDDMKYAICVKSHPGLTDIFTNIVRDIEESEDEVEDDVESDDMTMGGMQ